MEKFVLLTVCRKSSVMVCFLKGLSVEEGRPFPEKESVQVERSVMLKGIGSLRLFRAMVSDVSRLENGGSVHSNTQ